MILSRACRPKFHHKEMQDKSAIGRHDKHRGRAIERKRRGLILPAPLPVIRAEKASIAAAISGNDETLDQAVAERSFGAQMPYLASGSTDGFFGDAESTTRVILTDDRYIIDGKIVDLVNGTVRHQSNSVAAHLNRLEKRPQKPGDPGSAG